MRRPRPVAPWVNALHPGSSGTSQESILGQLRSAILDGDAPAGVPIQVDDVANRFQVSRIPVREALRTLMGEGLVAHQPRSGYAVAQVSPEELSELYVVREQLESAVLRFGIPQATDADAEAAAAALSALTDALEHGDARGHHRESRRFHMAVAAPCRMPRLLHAFESVWNITEPERPMSDASPVEVSGLADDHQQMLDALIARDVASALEASTRHYVRLQEVIASIPRRRHGGYADGPRAQAI
jgi:DNA-binding GntR family transcriptional regulator